MRANLTEEQANKTCDVKGTLRGDLEIMRLPKSENKSAFIIYCPENSSVLCFGYKYYSDILYIPLEWDTFAKAERWIREGCISELQEGLGELNVGFKKEILGRFSRF